MGLPSEGERECPICKKIFHYKRAGCNKLPITCSKECRYKYISQREFKQIPRICVICGKVFTIPPCWIKKNRGNDGTYCSNRCRWKNKIKYPNQSKIDARNAVGLAVRRGSLKKQSCSVCENPKVEAHHYKGYKKGNWLDIIWFCNKHHNQEHERLRRLALLNLL